MLRHLVKRPHTGAAETSRCSGPCIHAILDARQLAHLVIHLLNPGVELTRIPTLQQLMQLHITFEWDLLNVRALQAQGALRAAKEVTSHQQAAQGLMLLAARQP